MARTARLDSHILNFRIGSLTRNLRIGGVILVPAAGRRTGQSHFHLKPRLEYLSHSTEIDWSGKGISCRELNMERRALCGSEKGHARKVVQPTCAQAGGFGYCLLM
jgi:hypothetical protein